jgi:hypothetical protein
VRCEFKLGGLDKLGGSLQRLLPLVCTVVTLLGMGIVVNGLVAHAA